MRIAFVSDAGENLGLEYIAAVLKKSGHDIRLFVDNKFFDDEYIKIKWLNRIFGSEGRIIEGLKDYKPDLIGVSVMTQYYQWASGIAKIIKQNMNVPIIFGGVHPTSASEQVIQNDFVDMVCIGEGEYPMLELVESMSCGEIDYSIKNIWFKRDNVIIKNEVRSLLDDLDKLPFADKELFYSKYSNYRKIYYIMASRGCCFSCHYCCHSYLKDLYEGKGKYFRLRSVDNVIEELRYAKEKYKIKCVRFYDDNFGVDEFWLEDFSIKYGKNVGLPFVCYMHPVHINDQKAKLLSNAGYCEICAGFQSFNPTINKEVLNRGYTAETVQKAICSLKKYNLRYAIDNIVGIPGETEQDWLNMAEFYNQNRPNATNLYWLKIFPGTKISEWAMSNKVITRKDYEKITEGIDCENYNIASCINNLEFTKLHSFIHLIPILPKKLVSFLLKKKMYKYFPRIEVKKMWRSVEAVILRYFMKENGENLSFNFKILGKLDSFRRKLWKGK